MFGTAAAAAGCSSEAWAVAAAGAVESALRDLARPSKQLYLLSGMCSK